MKVAKYLFGPQIHPAFPWIAVRKLDHRDALRPEKQKQGDDPEPDRHAAIRRNTGNDIQIKYGDNKQQH